MWRIRNRYLCRKQEGLSQKEMLLPHDFHHWKGFLLQMKRARNYSDHSFVKLTAPRLCQRLKRRGPRMSTHVAQETRANA